MEQKICSQECNLEIKRKKEVTVYKWSDVMIASVKLNDTSERMNWTAIEMMLKTIKLQRRLLQSTR